MVLDNGVLFAAGFGVRLHPKTSDEIEHRTARLVDDADQLGADLEQEHERADDDERNPVAEARIGHARLNNGAGAEERRDAVDDEHRRAVAETELLQAVMQMAFVRREDRLLLDPPAYDGEERIRERYANDKQRRYERYHGNLLEPEHRERRQGEA